MRRYALRFLLVAVFTVVNAKADLFSFSLSFNGSEQECERVG